MSARASPPRHRPRPRLSRQLGGEGATSRPSFNAKMTATTVEVASVGMWRRPGHGGFAVVRVGQGVALAALQQVPVDGVAGEDHRERKPLHRSPVLRSGAWRRHSRAGSGGTEGRQRHVITLAAGVSELATGAPLRPAAHFRAGSLTKSFVATVVLQLAEEGKFSVHDTVGQRLPRPSQVGQHHHPAVAAVHQRACGLRRGPAGHRTTTHRSQAGLAAATSKR